MRGPAQPRRCAGGSLSKEHRGTAGALGLRQGCHQGALSAFAERDTGPSSPSVGSESAEAAPISQLTLLGMLDKSFPWLCNSRATGVSSQQ